MGFLKFLVIYINSFIAITCFFFLLLPAYFDNQNNGYIIEKSFEQYNVGHLQENIESIDEVFDIRRCENLTVSIETIGSSSKLTKWRKVFDEVAILKTTREDACVKIVITDRQIDQYANNAVVVNIGTNVLIPPKGNIIVQSTISRNRRSVDFALSLDVDDYKTSLWAEIQPVLPFSRKIFTTLILQKETSQQNLNLFKSFQSLNISFTTLRSTIANAEIENEFKNSMFCSIGDDKNYLKLLNLALKSACIPIIPSTSLTLPFEDLIDWKSISIRTTRSQKLPNMLSSFSPEDILEMRRRGRLVYENYIADRRAIARTILAALHFRMGVELPNREPIKALPLFKDSFYSPEGDLANVTNEQYVGPIISKPAKIKSFAHSSALLHPYAHEMWNRQFSPWFTPEFINFDVDPPVELGYFNDFDSEFDFTKGTGKSFREHLGGNRPREQFTVVLVTYDRDAHLNKTLRSLHQLPFLNKVVVIWNNMKRVPPTSWPKLHVPVEFIKPSQNDLNNRFIPWDRIDTEAILSLDDDIIIPQEAIVFGFRIWRENRNNLVGYMTRSHSRRGNYSKYDFEKCEYSLIITDSAFIHKRYLEAYTYDMPEAIRNFVKENKNCEDIAMNFLVAHLTRKPPVKATQYEKKWCSSDCGTGLSSRNGHYTQRSECIELFTKIYGYNPLRFSQLRASTVLQRNGGSDKDKCFPTV